MFWVAPAKRFMRERRRSRVFLFLKPLILFPKSVKRFRMKVWRQTQFPPS